MGDIKSIIAAISPELHSDLTPGGIRKLKKILVDKGVSDGIDAAKDAGLLKPKSVQSFKMTFDSQQAQLEPIYYWLLDFVQDMGWGMEKLTDNFTASPGSGQFSEMSMKATKMQEEGMKILGGLNQVVKSVLNLIYDLKEFELRLAHYDDANSEDSKKKEEGMLALKNIWLDNVDLKRGRGSIHQMAAELGFTTLREAFMIASTQEELKEMNKGKDGEGGLVNDSVYRVLVPRLSEFLKWADYSEKELRKRFSIERNYLKSQVETIKLYSGWMKPYLKAAEDLRQRGFDKDAALVNAFSTSMFELQIFGKKSMDVPGKFKGYKLKRDYNQCILIGLKYRGHVSQRVTQKGDMGFGMGGRIDMTFDAFSLNDEEYKLVRKEFDDEDVKDSMIFSVDVAGDALADLKEDLDYFLKSDEEKAKEEAEEKKKTGESLDINPFGALFGLFKGGSDKVKREKGEVTEVKDIKPDNYVERAIRAEAAEAAGVSLHTVYDIYKKAHGMASAPGDGFEKTEMTEEEIEKAKIGGKVGFWGAFKGKGSN